MDTVHGLGAVVANPTREKPALPPLRAVGDYVLLRPIRREEQTAGGLFIPQNSAEKNITYEGEVVAARPRYQTPKGAWVDSPVKIGDRCLYYRFESKRQHLLNGSEVHAVKYTEIVGVVE